MSLAGRDLGEHLFGYDFAYDSVWRPQVTAKKDLGCGRSEDLLPAGGDKVLL